MQVSMLTFQFFLLKFLKGMMAGSLQDRRNHFQRALGRRALFCSHQLRWAPQGRRFCTPPRIPRRRNLRALQRIHGPPCGKESLRARDGAISWKTKASATTDPPTRVPAHAFLSQLGSRIKVSAGIWVLVITVFVHLQFFTLSCLCRSSLLSVFNTVLYMSVHCKFSDGHGPQSVFDGSPCVGRHAHV
jgi:hypothetical protein